MGPRLRYLPVAAFAFATLLASGRASAAPTVAFSPTPPIRLASDDKTQIATLIVHGNQQGINYRECIDDTYIRFTLNLGGIPTSDSLQAWAGTGDCTQQGATTGATATCWPIFSGNITPVLTTQVDIRIADIVSQLYTPTKVLTYQHADAATVCSSAASSSTTTTTTDAGSTVSSGETSVNLWFMWFAGGNSTPDSNAPAYPIKVKLVGPNAPTNVVAKSGDGEIIVSWNAPVGEADLQGFNVYYASAGGISNDAGSVGDGGIGPGDAGAPSDAASAASCSGAIGTSDAGAPSAASCSGTIDTSDQAIDAGATVVKQAAGTTNASATVTGLTNGASYAVAVAGFDSFQNDGILSSVVCATPEPIEDFWTKYRTCGGTAGGFCALQVAGGSGGATFGALAALIAGAAVARYRRRCRRDNDNHRP